MKNNIFQTVMKLQEDDIEAGHYYVQVLDYLRETAHCLTFIADPVFSYIDNNHPPLIKDQQNDLQDLAEQINKLFSKIIQSIKNADYRNLNQLFESQQNLLDYIMKLKKRQLKRIKNRETGTRNSELILNTLTETKNLLLYVVNLLKAQRDFVIHGEENGKQD